MERSTTFFIGLAYFCASSMMLIVNKLAVTHLPIPTVVTSLQYVVAAAIVYASARLCKILEADTALRMDEVKRYVIVPFLFSLAIFSNMKLLETANVETFMVFRFSTPVFVALVDFALMGKALPNLRAWISFALIVAGAIIYTITDEGFSLSTYQWAVVYLLTITTEMIIVKHVFTTMKMTNWTRVYLNNLLSLLFQPVFFFMTQEYKKLPTLTVTPVGILFLVVSCILGTALAWSGTALRARVSATTFTVVGVACKVATELVNYFMWERHANQSGLLALLACFVGSLLFVPSENRSANTWISNAIWSLANKLSCGGLKRIELESPEFSEHVDGHQRTMNAAKYEAIPTRSDLGDDEGDVEMVETSK